MGRITPPLLRANETGVGQESLAHMMKDTEGMKYLLLGIVAGFIVFAIILLSQCSIKLGIGDKLRCVTY